MTTTQHTLIFKRESTAFVACWLNVELGDSGTLISCWSRSDDDEWLETTGTAFGLVPLPENNVLAHVALFAWDDELVIFTTSDLACDKDRWSSLSIENIGREREKERRRVENAYHLLSNGGCFSSSSFLFLFLFLNFKKVQWLNTVITWLRCMSSPVRCFREFKIWLRLDRRIWVWLFS